jgi:uncharacterized membrane protein YfcA
MPLQVAAPLAVLLSIAIAIVVVVQDWRHIHLGSAASLVAATLFGIPVGLWLLTHVSQELAKAALGILIAVFAGYLLMARNAPHLEHEHKTLLLFSGFLAGILGGAYGMNGPPLVLYGSLRKWSPQHFRATLQAYFLPASVLGMLGYWSAGLWTATVTREFVLALPVMLPAVFLGREINRRFSGETFVKYVYGGLLLIGWLLLSQAIAHCNGLWD